jgi:hypothetical protein
VTHHDNHEPFHDLDASGFILYVLLGCLGLASVGGGLMVAMVLAVMP